MAYVQHEWVSGETITEALLDHLETQYDEGVARINNKLLSHTRAMDAASGSVAYTGYGFQPKGLIVLAQTGNAVLGCSFGLADVNVLDLTMYFTETNIKYMTTKLVSLWETYASKGQEAVLDSYDADGFTLTWTRTGATAAGTATLYVLAIR